MKRKWRDCFNKIAIWNFSRNGLYSSMFSTQNKAMNKLSRRQALLALIFFGFFCESTRAQNLDIIGVTLLRTVATNVDGSGIRVAQPEAGLDTNNPPMIWEVNPAAVGQPANLFTY